MASFNKCMLIGRLTDDAKVISFRNGGAVAQFTIAVNHRKKNSETGEWEEEASFIDAKLFKRGENGRQVEIFTQYVHKGNMVFLEGQIRQERWTTEGGDKRSKLVLHVDNFQILESPRGEGSSSSGGFEDDYGAGEFSSGMKTASAPDEPSYSGCNSGGSEEDIPF